MSADHIRDPATLTDAEIEQIEKQSLRWLFQAAADFGPDAYEIFRQSSDDVKDIAEDITREMLDRLGGYPIPQRILGNVDYRKARYIILPELLVRQALFVDSKAEKDMRTATIQMSQTSLRIRQTRSGNVMDEPGKLPPLSVYRGLPYLTTTMLAHYFYEEIDAERFLRAVTLAAIPNGRLQDIYNPTSEDTIWRAGRDAPSRGEDFRVRLNFAALAMKTRWRIQKVAFDPVNQQVTYRWEE